MSCTALRWLLDAVKGKKRYVAVEIVLQALVGLGYICFSLLFREMIDRAVEQDTPGFFRFLLILIFVAIVRIALNAAIRRVEEYACAVLENALKKRLFATLLSRDYASVTAVHTAQWMNRLTSDTVVVSTSVAKVIPNLAGMVIKMIGAFCAILILEPKFAFVVIPAGIALIVMGYFVRPLMKRLHGDIQEADGNVRELIQERLDNLLIVDAYSRQAHSVEMAGQRMEAHLHARMKRNNMSNVNQVGFNVAIQGMYLVAAGFCAWGILHGTVSYGTMTALLQMISYLQSPLAGMGGYFTQWYAMLSSSERLMEAESLPADIAEGMEDQYTDSVPDMICLENLVFSYVEKVEDQEMLHTIHYEDQYFRKGEFIALAGPSGCGKSTLLKLLMGIYRPDSGRILLARGSVRKLLTAEHRRLFAYVPQGNMLMSGTIRQIITFYDSKAMEREADLRRALRVSCCEEFVDALPQGMDTVLGEHGSGLSEGQIQRIALARAVFSDRPVLLLDEATSALDEQTEALLLENLKTMTDKTVLIVTHRPRACEICDRVIRMERCQEGGSHDESGN